MIPTHASVRRAGWAALLALCCALLFALSLKVNAVKSEVRLTERRIVALKQETMYLETEYETRSNQQQLAAWNAVDFGYVAPGPSQYLESERQLASLGKPVGPEAPAPIRVAAATAQPPATLLPAMVSPLTGKPLGDEQASDFAAIDHDRAAAQLAERLARPEQVEEPARKRDAVLREPVEAKAAKTNAVEKRL